LGQGLNFGGPGRGIDNIASITCDTAEGIVHRLWEPLAVKQRPPNAYSAKFSVPFCVAYGLTRGAVGLEAFTEENAHDPQLLAIAAKVGYVIDPNNPYPDEYTGHVRVTHDGRARARGAPAAPARRAARAAHARRHRGEIPRNCDYGQWDRRASRRGSRSRARRSTGPIDLKAFRG
jgi:2-methylcitrate dehydratase PrpD